MDLIYKDKDVILIAHSEEAGAREANFWRKYAQRFTICHYINEK